MKIYLSRTRNMIKPMPDFISSYILNVLRTGMQVGFLFLLSFFLVHPGDCQTHVKNRLTPHKAHTSQNSHAPEEVPADNAVQQLKNHLKRLRDKGLTFDRRVSLQSFPSRPSAKELLRQSKMAFLTAPPPKPHELNCILLI